MKAALWLLVGALALAGCEDKSGAGDKPAPAQDDKAKTEAKEGEKAKADEAKAEGDTKPAKDMPASEDVEILTEQSPKLLEALKSKNIEAIAAFVPESERAEATKAFTDGGTAAKSFFTEGEWRHKAVQAWDGKLHGIRIEGDTARVKFGEIEGKESAVVEWKKQDDKWYFKDVKSPSNEEFAKWGQEAGQQAGEQAADEAAAEPEEAK
jgi:hypothetical protein